MDPVSTTTAIMTGLSQAIDITKNLREADLKLNEAENKHKIAELYSSLAQVKMDLADLKNELSYKDQKIKELTQQINKKASVLFEQNMYYFMDGDTKNGPFCTKCYDTDNKSVRPYQTTPTEFTCRACNSWYSTKPPEYPTIGLARSDYNDYTY